MMTRIGVFFDETGNNMWNDEAINDGSMSNVAKLYKLYEKNKYKVMYAEGVGTEAYTKNYTFINEGQDKNENIIGSIWNGKDKNDYYEKWDLGFGGSAKDMVEKKLTEIKQFIDEIIKDNSKEEIIIDVYGFSRGATQARDFINEINKQYVHTKNKTIVGFVGLFDTVASIGFANSYNYDYNINLNENSAQQILHITADDEERSNFPLEKLASNGTNITEMSGMGAHSDIGGGYGELDRRKKLVVKDSVFTHEYSNESDGQDKIDELQAKANMDGYELIYEYGSTPDENDNYLLEALFVEDRLIEHGLSNAYLHIMHQNIKDAGINLAPLSTLGSSENGFSHYEVPNYDSSYVHISSSNDWYGSSVSDWIKNHKDLSGYRSEYDNEPHKAEDTLQSFDKYDRTFMKKSNSSTGKVFGEVLSRDELIDAGYSDMYQADRTEYFSYYLDNSKYENGNSKDSYISLDENGINLYGTTDNKIIFGDNLNNDTQLKGGSGDDRIYGQGGDDELVGGAGYDYMEGGSGVDILRGGDNADTLLGGNDTDILYGDAGDDTLLGGDDNAHDTLFGGAGSDTLLGQAGDDTLVGGDSDNFYAEKKSDYLLGGTGFDTYYVSHKDVINDADLDGLIMFNDKSLSGKKTKVDDNTYEDTNFTYTIDGSNMIVADKNLGEYITIENFNFNSDGMGMKFDDSNDDPTKKDIEIFVGDATVTEGGNLEFTVGIDNTLDKDLTLHMDSYFNGSAEANDIKMPNDKTITILAGQPSGTFSIDTVNDLDSEDTENFIFAVTSYEYLGDDTNSILIKNAGKGNIVDNDKDIKITIESDSTTEGNIDDSNTLSFRVSASRTLVGDESVTLNLSIKDITTDWADYGFLSDDAITLSSSNQSQIITLELFGDTQKEETETLSINASISNSTNLENIQIVSGIGTIVNDDSEGGSGEDEDDEATPQDDILILTDEDDVVDGLAGDDYIEGKGGNDILSGNTGDDILWGGDGDDMLYGDEGNDILFGDSGDDYLEGGTGDDILYGGDGDDVLLGGEGKDYLNGGDGFDYYITDNGDTVEDSDGKGAVFFNNADLTGRKKKNQTSGVYEDDNNTYEESGSDLVITSKGNGESINIVSWSNKSLGIELVRTEDVIVSVGDAEELEAAEIARVSVELKQWGQVLNFHFML